MPLLSWLEHKHTYTRAHRVDACAVQGNAGVLQADLILAMHSRRQVYVGKEVFPRNR